MFVCMLCGVIFVCRLFFSIFGFLEIFNISIWVTEQMSMQFLASESLIKYCLNKIKKF